MQTTPAAEPLPALHPGTPGYGTVAIRDLKIVRETEKAVQFDRAGKLFWLPRSAINFRGPDLPWLTISVSVKVWFYLKNYKSL